MIYALIIFIFGIVWIVFLAIFLSIKHVEFCDKHFPDYFSLIFGPFFIIFGIVECIIETKDYIEYKRNRS